MFLALSCLLRKLGHGRKASRALDVSRALSLSLGAGPAAPGTFRRSAAKDKNSTLGQNSSASVGALASNLRGNYQRHTTPYSKVRSVTQCSHSASAKEPTAGRSKDWRLEQAQDTAESRHPLELSKESSCFAEVSGVRQRSGKLKHPAARPSNTQA